MESKLAKEARLALLADARRLTREQRLNAFLVHCELMMQLHAAGQRLRRPLERPRAAGESVDRALLERLAKRYGRDAAANLKKLLAG